MEIREALVRELPAILHLQRELDPEVEMTLQQALEIWQRMQQYPFYKVFVAADGNDIIGTFSLLIVDNLGHSGVPIAVVENVVVDPAWQGKGIGKLMMEKAMNLAAAKGCYKLMLSSNSKREAAHKFYDSLGFERHGVSFRVEVSK